MENESQEQINNNKPWLYKKGQSGNPGGRPKGSKTLKTYIQERFLSMTDEEREDFLDGLPKETIWKMGEGNPDTKTDLTSKGEKISTQSDLDLDSIAKELAAKIKDAHSTS